MKARDDGGGVIARYRAWLPVTEQTPIVSLDEGNTPLLPLSRIGNGEYGCELELYAKCEGLNPTGSFKDRGMTVAVSKALEEGAEAIICASTGNTSASAAAYAARAGMVSFVLIPEGRIARGKLAQAVMHGAVALQIQGNFDIGMRLVRKVAEEAPVTVVNSVNPYRIQGQKTAAFEIVEALGRVPDYHFLPVGNAGNISAYWIGYSEYAGHDTAACSLCEGGPCHFQRLPRSDARPVMRGCQASGAAPFLLGSMVDAPETVATAIRIGHPQSWDQAWAAVKESDGLFVRCTDEEILAAQKLLADVEGIFCEPASAASVAGLLQQMRAGQVRPGSTVVCTLTGHGLKDPDTAMAQAGSALRQVEAEPDAVRRAILDGLGRA